LTPEKNPFFLIKAVSTVRKPRPTFVWVANVVWGPGFRDQVLRLAESVGVNFDLRVDIPDGELVDLLNRATVLLYAPRLEPFGLAPLEANACGLPVIAVPEGGVRETVVHGLNGLLLPPDPGQLGAGIAELLDNPSYARTLGENGVAFAAERWSLDAADDRLEKILLDLASPPPTG
jgi:glycosyltransferase involved in cell wall biosynthesis